MGSDRYCLRPFWLYKSFLRYLQLRMPHKPERRVESTQLTAARSGRKPSVVICGPCRRRKQKCTGMLPCKRCADKGCPEDCEYEVGPKPTPFSIAGAAANTDPRMNGESDELKAKLYIQYRLLLSDVMKNMHAMKLLPTRTRNDTQSLLSTPGAYPETSQTSSEFLEPSTTTTDMELELLSSGIQRWFFTPISPMITPGEMLQRWGTSPGLEPNLSYSAFGPYSNLPWQVTTSPSPSDEEFPAGASRFEDYEPNSGNSDLDDPKSNALPHFDQLEGTDEAKWLHYLNTGSTSP